MTPLELRGLMEEHRFAGYDSDQVWMTCTCGEDCLDLDGHVAEKIAELQRIREERATCEARVGWIKHDEHVRISGGLIRQINDLSLLNRDMSSEIISLKLRLLAFERRVRSAVSACGAAVKNGPWTNVRWTIGVKGIMNELSGETEGANLLKDWVPIGLKNEGKPWLKGDPWKHHGRGR